MTSLTPACLEENVTLTWVAPAYCDVRLGFEVTAYVYVR
ncbi:pyrroloquinoline quinone precursor peptide PqqA [Hyphomicrobium sp. LHD-15]|nr:pyrroloquinoline quinone precursor peptide PqqA [Hyphomicrobium sp. LHD-15]MDQ8698266.1 pyrroloquinoline quinone precursor peptide PqqA [Hyphomicrobium sp. LHD-15]